MQLVIGTLMLYISLNVQKLLDDVSLVAPVEVVFDTQAYSNSLNTTSTN